MTKSKNQTIELAKLLYENLTLLGNMEYSENNDIMDSLGSDALPLVVSSNRKYFKDTAELCKTNALMLKSMIVNCEAQTATTFESIATLWESIKLAYTVYNSARTLISHSTNYELREKNIKCGRLLNTIQLIVKTYNHITSKGYEINDCGEIDKILESYNNTGVLIVDLTVDDNELIALLDDTRIIYNKLDSLSHKISQGEIQSIPHEIDIMDPSE